MPLPGSLSGPAIAGNRHAMDHFRAGNSHSMKPSTYIAIALQQTPKCGSFNTWNKAYSKSRCWQGLVKYRGHITRNAKNGQRSDESPDESQLVQGMGRGQDMPPPTPLLRLHLLPRRHPTRERVYQLIQSWHSTMFDGDNYLANTLCWPVLSNKSGHTVFKCIWP